jgi:prepilin-type N-terminal cleavage/methylation domain-containing protein
MLKRFLDKDCKDDMVRRGSFRAKFHEGKSGFTLLEIIIAMAIMGLVISITYASFSAITNRMEEMENISRVYHTARIIMDRIYLDLTSTYIKAARPGKDNDFFFQCLEALPGSNLWQRFSFTSTAHLPISPDDPGLDTCRISYELRNDPDGDSLLFYRLDEPLFTETNKRESVPMLLGQGLSRFSMEFFDNERNSAHSWDSTQGVHRDQLPVRVTISFALKGEKDLEYPFTFGCTMPLAQQ